MKNPLERTGRRRRAAASVAALVIAATLAPGCPEANAQGARADWITPSGNQRGWRYSPLDQIDTTNVAGLVEEFKVPTGAPASHQGQPLVVDGVMYVVTPFPHRLIAIDSQRGGAIIWTFEPEANLYAHGVACCDVVNRGAAYGAGLVVFNTLDDTTVAVDARTGGQVWRTVHGRPETGETITGAPLVTGRMVIVGNAGAELGVRGWVAGLDLMTGRQVWRAYATGPDREVRIGAGFRPFYEMDRGTDLGVATWPGTLWKQGGGTSWAWFTYDPDLNLFFHGTANPGVWNPTMRAGARSNPDPRRSDNKWGATIFARNPETGNARWAYQVTPHDGWDFDAVNENIVADLVVRGLVRKVIVHFDKNGFAYTIDRATGEVLVAEPFGAVNWARGISRVNGRPQLVPEKLPREGRWTDDICPSQFGAKDMEPAAFSPKTKLFYVPAINLCSYLLPLKALYIAGSPFMGADVKIAPGPAGPGGEAFQGELVAWDAATGARKWSVREPLPLYGGALATAGGLVFYGTLDKRFKAVHAETGRVLLDVALECGVVGNPIAFAGPDGRQRIAVYSGVGWLPGGFAGGACAAKPPGASVAGGLLHVFRLP